MKLIILNGLLRDVQNDALVAWAPSKP